MFTGLVAGTGVVRALQRSDDGGRLRVAASLADALEPGGSVAVSGVCLTAVERSADTFTVDVMAETLARSALGGLEAGDRVNLELPLRAGDRIGGHIVQGHVDGVGRIDAVAGEGFARRLSVRADSGICRYVADKGSVAVDGVSLTAVEVTRDGFAVVLVPETLERTTLGGLATGDSVNIEVDVLAKYVERLMAAAGDQRLEAGVPR